MFFAGALSFVMAEFILLYIYDETIIKLSNNGHLVHCYPVFSLKNVLKYSAFKIFTQKVDLYEITENFIDLLLVVCNLHYECFPLQSIGIQ